MEKKQVRATALAQLVQTSNETKQQIMDACLTQLMSRSQWQDAQSIGITYSMADELPTQKIILAALGAGKKVYLPRCKAHRQMDFLPYQSGDELIPSQFGVLEPHANLQPAKQLNLLIVPGLLFALDTKKRLGFGGGYFDVYLSNNQPQATIALTGSMQCVETAIWPIEDFDQSVDEIIVGVID